MKNLFKYLISFLILVLLPYSYSFADNLSSKNSSNNAPLRIGLNPWIGTGLFYVAQAKGLFATEKLNVQLIKYDDGAVGKQLLASGQIDMLATTPETVVVLDDAGVKVKIVGILDTSKGADGVIATKEISRIDDLKGKKVAFEVGSSSHLLLSYLLNQKGLTTNDLTIENLAAPDAGAAFVAGKVDAAVTWEPWLSKAIERPGGHILIDSKALPIFPDFYIFRASTVAQRPKDIQAMLRALFTAKKFINEHPDEALKIIADNLNITKSEAATEVKTLEWLDYPQNMYYFIGSPSKVENLLQETADLWFKLGLIKHKVIVPQIIDPSPLKNLYQ